MSGPCRARVAWAAPSGPLALYASDLHNQSKGSEPRRPRRGEPGGNMRRADGVRGGRLGRPALWAWTALALLSLGTGMLSPAGHGAARFAARLAVAATTLSRQAPRARPAF